MTLKIYAVALTTVNLNILISSNEQPHLDPAFIAMSRDADGRWRHSGTSIPNDLVVVISKYASTTSLIDTIVRTICNQRANYTANSEIVKMISGTDWIARIIAQCRIDVGSNTYLQDDIRVCRELLEKLNCQVTPGDNGCIVTPNPTMAYGAPKGSFGCYDTFSDLVYRVESKDTAPNDEIHIRRTAVMGVIRCMCMKWNEHYHSLAVKENYKKSFIVDLLDSIYINPLQYLHQSS